MRVPLSQHCPPYGRSRQDTHTLVSHHLSVGHRRGSQEPCHHWGGQVTR